MFSDRLKRTDRTNLLLINCAYKLYRRFRETFTKLFNECFLLCYKYKRVIDIKKPHNTSSVKELIYQKRIKRMKLYIKIHITYRSAYKTCVNKLNIKVRKANWTYSKDKLTIVDEVKWRNPSKNMIINEVKLSKWDSYRGGWYCEYL